MMLCLQGHFPRIFTQINHVFIGFIILSGSTKRKCVLKSKGFLFLIIMSYSHKSKCPCARNYRPVRLMDGFIHL